MIDATMGLVYTKIKVRNLLTKSDYLEIDCKIDTGATLLVLPEKDVKELGLPVIRQQNVKYANEDVQERDVVWGVEVTLCGRIGVFEAIVEPKKKLCAHRCGGDGSTGFDRRAKKPGRVSESTLFAPDG